MGFAPLIPIEPVDRNLSATKYAHGSEARKSLDVSFFDDPSGDTGHLTARSATDAQPRAGGLKIAT